jgi:hypothetical protein
MLVALQPTHAEPTQLQKRRKKPLALRLIGPKSAFFKNRINEAFEDNASVARKRKASVLFDEPQLRVTIKVASQFAPPIHKTGDDTAFRILDCDADSHLDACYLDDDDTFSSEGAITVVKPAEVATRCLVPTLPSRFKEDDSPDDATNGRWLASLNASFKLESTFAVDETREAIANTIKDLHAGVPYLWRQLTFLVFLELAKRGIPEKTRRGLVRKRYRVFDAKMLYYGDFVGKTVHVIDKDATWKTGTVVHYHPFDGFVAERLVNGARETFAVTHDTLWVWGF